MPGVAGSPRVHAWLELIRPPNLPTIASNAVLGMWLGGLAQGRTLGLPGSSWSLDEASLRFDGSDLVLLARVITGLCGLYVVGLILNDVFDLAVDRRERPQRPLPSGRVRVGHAVIAAIAIWLGSLWMLGAMGGGDAFVDPPLLLWSMLLTAAIVAYDLLHTRVAWAVALPAVCRGLAVLLAAMAATPAPESEASAAWIPWEGVGLAVVLVPAGVVALFVFAVSIVARREVAVDRRSCPACGQTLLEDAVRCPECGRAVSAAEGRLRTAGELGRAPWWVVASGTLCLLPAVGFGAWLPHVAASPLVDWQWLRDLATLAMFAAWFRVVASWTAETPVPRLVGRWLGSLCLLDAVMLAPLGPAPVAIGLVLHGIGRGLARRFTGS